MKIGPLEFYYHPGDSSIHDAVSTTVKTHPAFRELVARMARAEVKNYLETLAEEADMPFTGPAEFLRSVRCPSS